jgi:hypothetical protein
MQRYRRIGEVIGWLYWSGKDEDQYKNLFLDKITILWIKYHTKEYNILLSLDEKDPVEERRNESLEITNWSISFIVIPKNDQK